MNQVTRNFKTETVTIEKEVPNGFTIQISDELATFFAAMYGMSGNVSKVPEQFRNIAEEFRKIGQDIDIKIDRNYSFKIGSSIYDMFNKEVTPFSNY